MRRKSDFELLGTFPGDVPPEPLGENPEHNFTFAVDFQEKKRLKIIKLFENKKSNKMTFSNILYTNHEVYVSIHAMLMVFDDDGDDDDGINAMNFHVRQANYSIN